MLQWKQKFGKVSKRGVLKITGLALTIGLAFNYTRTEIGEIKQLIQPDSLRVGYAEPDPNTYAFLDSMRTLVADRQLTPKVVYDFRDSIRFVTVYRDSLVIREQVVIRDSLVRKVVWDTLTTEPDPPNAWQTFRGGPLVRF